MTLCVLLVVLFSCVAQHQDGGGGDCRGLGLVAAAKPAPPRPAAPRPAAPRPVAPPPPAVPLHKDQTRTAPPVRKAPHPARTGHHGRGGVDVDLDVDLGGCP